MRPRLAVVIVVLLFSSCDRRASLPDTVLLEPLVTLSFATPCIRTSAITVRI